MNFALGSSNVERAEAGFETREMAVEQPRGTTHLPGVPATVAHSGEGGRSRAIGVASAGAPGSPPLAAPPDRKRTGDSHLRAGIASALTLWQERGDLAALATAVTLQRVLESSPTAGPVRELIVARCAWCPPEKTDALTAFAARHALKLTDGCCPGCATRLRQDMQRVVAAAHAGRRDQEVALAP